MPQENDTLRRLIDDMRQEANKAQTLNVAMIEVARRDIAVLQGQIIVFEKALISRVERLEFIPVKLIAYALAGGTLTTVMGAVLSKVILK